MPIAASLLSLLIACVGDAPEPAADAAGTDEVPTTAAPVSNAEPAEPPSADWPEAPDGPRVEVVVDLTEPGSGELHVTQHYWGLLPQMWGLKQLGKDKEVAIEDIEVAGPGGEGIRFHQSGREIKLKGKEQSEIIVTYTVKPGGDGRHGHQGMVNADWSTFDGRIFLLPKAASELRGARVRFEAPEGWIAGSPLLEKDGWLYAEQYGRDKIQVSLSSACFGVGPQARHVETVNGVEVRVFTPMSSTPMERARLDRETVGIMRWFTEALDFRPDFPMTWVWTPYQAGKRVYGGSAAHGTCMEQPRSRTRAWELMAHRVAHSMNKYPPTGMHIEDERDHWFKEGWPSYIELEALTGGQVRRTAERWNRLYNRYLEVREEEPELDLAMADEPGCRGETCEYMHYYKGPVVVKMLDDFIIRHHEGKDLAGFMAKMHDEYGSFQGDFPLREELDAYVGGSLDAWWEVFVDTRGYHFPVWPEAIDSKLKLAAARDGAATIAGRPVSGDYLYHLASSGDFTSFASIVEFIEREEARRVQLAEAGIVLLPPELEEYRAGFEPETRYNLARAELAWPVFPQEVSTDGYTLEWTRGDADAETFQALLADEQRYHETMAGTGMERMRIFTAVGDGEFSDEAVLAFPGNVRTRLVTNWHWAAPVGRVQIGRGGEVVEERELVMQPDWTMWRTIQDVKERPAGDGVVTYTIQDVADRPIVRSYWQRGG